MSRRQVIPVKFVSFSGIDGAGKSTQIQALRARLSEAGLRVRLIIFWEDVAQLTRLREDAGHKIFKGDKGVGSPSAPIARRDKNVRSWPMTCFRMFLYLLDTFSVRRVMRRASRLDDDVVIFDRYIYDELANLSLGNRIVRAYVRLMMKLVPRPDVSFLLDADPVQARARKPEYPLDFIQINRQSYIDLSHLIGGMTIIVPMPIPDVQQEVLDNTLEAFSSQPKHGALAQKGFTDRSSKANNSRAGQVT